MPIIVPVPRRSRRRRNWKRRRKRNIVIRLMRRISRDSTMLPILYRRKTTTMIIPNMIKKIKNRRKVKTISQIYDHLYPYILYLHLYILYILSILLILIIHYHLTNHITNILFYNSHFITSI